MSRERRTEPFQPRLGQRGPGSDRGAGDRFAAVGPSNVCRHSRSRRTVTAFLEPFVGECPEEPYPGSSPEMCHAHSGHQPASPSRRERAVQGGGHRLRVHRRHRRRNAGPWRGRDRLSSIPTKCTARSDRRRDRLLSEPHRRLAAMRRSRRVTARYGGRSSARAAIRGRIASNRAATLRLRLCAPRFDQARPSVRQAAAERYTPLFTVDAFSVDYVSDVPLCMLAYVIRPHAAAALIAAARVITAPVDKFIQRTWDHGQPVFALSPAAVTSRPDAAQSCIGNCPHKSRSVGLLLARAIYKMRGELRRIAFDRRQLRRFAQSYR